MGFIEGAQLRPVTGFAFTVGAEAANVITVAVQALWNGEPISEAVKAEFYLSTLASGLDLATNVDGVAAGTDGFILSEYVDNHYAAAVTEADGNLDIAITETGVRTIYLVVMSHDGRLSVSPAITFA